VREQVVVFAHELMTVVVCSDTLRLLMMVTPMIFAVVARSMPGISLHACLSAFDFGVFRPIYLQIIGLRPCLGAGQLFLSTAGVYGWNDVVSELDHLVAMRH